SHQLTITNSDGTVITSNTFFDHGGNVISLEETLGRTPTRIANNSISAAGGMGIMVQQDPTHLANLEIVNNTIDNGGENTGLSLSIVTGGIQSYRILVQGNDFHNTAVGVLITGQAISAFIDLGGGLNESLGGNDFRGFTVSRPAIDDEVGGGNLISARQNIFSSGVVPASVVVASSGDTLDVAEPLSDERAFVQTLYNQTLGRSGTLPELDPWVSLLGTQ